MKENLSSRFPTAIIQGIILGITVLSLSILQQIPGLIMARLRENAIVRQIVYGLMYAKLSESYVENLLLSTTKKPMKTMMKTRKMKLGCRHHQAA